MMDQALSDVRVLDLTWHIAGPYCTKLLADYGADVLKVERPGQGDPARTMGPFFQDDPHPEKSGLFLHLNTNKRGITLNLKSEAGKRVVKELARDVDIIVESFKPGVMASLGLDYETLEKINPRLVMTSIANFGQTGPYRDFEASEITLFGGGTMFCYGLPEREPIKRGGTVVLYQGGAIAALATMMAFYSARYQGVGQHVDISLFETQVGCIDKRMSHILAYTYNQEVSYRRDVRAEIGYPHGVYPCADGYVDVSYAFIAWPRVARMIDRPDLVDDPVLSSPLAMIDPEAKAKLEPLWIGWLMEHTKREVIDAGQREGVLCAPLNTTEDLVNDPHWQERGFWAEVDHPMTGKLTYPGAPVQGTETSWQIRMPAPLLGQHNQEVYCKLLGYSKDDLVMLRECGII